VLRVDVTSAPELIFASSRGETSAWVNDTGWHTFALPFTADANTSGVFTYNLTATFVEGEANAATELDTFTFTGSVTVVAAEIPVASPAGLSTPALVGLSAVAILAGGYGAYALKQRADRAKMNRAPRRSQALREVELEKQAEKRPEDVVKVQEEIRQQEQVREKRRELQILEAKRADALKTLDLLQKRHSAGGLSKHQYDNMRAKKEADLVKIETEIAQMESEDRGAAA
jgi:hypothetical protein